MVEKSLPAEEQRDAGNSLSVTNRDTVNPGHSFRFSKAEILRGYNSFGKVLHRSRVVQYRDVRCHYIIQEEIPPFVCKVGFAFRKTRNAVERNHLKRLFRESYRQQKSDLMKLCESRRIQLRCVFLADAREMRKAEGFETFFEITGELLRQVQKKVRRNCPES